MALGLTLSSFTFSRLNLGPKAVLSAALLIAVNTVLVMGAGYWSLTRDFDTRAKRDIDVNLRTLSLAFSETFPSAKIAIRDGVVERIETPQMPEFGDHKIVDRATAYVGGNATLFVYDDASQQFVRRTTNVKKENGDRAVGTQLAAELRLARHQCGAGEIALRAQIFSERRGDERVDIGMGIGINHG